MARDYYPLLARAIAGLEEKAVEARRTVYDHARAVLVRHMRDLEAGLSTGFGELRALEEAILKVESEVAGPEEVKPVSIDESCKIAERAYLLWEQAGRPEGKALEYWLQAEAECSTEPSADPRYSPQVGKVMIGRSVSWPEQSANEGSPGLAGPALPVILNHRTIRSS